MTTEQKNILIAEYCGFKRYNPVGLQTGDNREWIPPNQNGYLLQWFYANCGQLPDFFTDLNACAEVEAKLSTSGMISQMDNYDCRLLKICGTHSAAISATAAQRAEAIGAVLKLWEAGE